LLIVLWRTPFPLSEGVSLIEDVDGIRHRTFLRRIPPTTVRCFTSRCPRCGATPVRPSARCRSIKLLHIVPVALVVVLFLWYVRRECG
jgi:hypothetical protein